MGGKKPMNKVELLLGLDTDTLTQIPTGELEIKRLSKMTGSKFTVELTALSGGTIDRLRKLSTDKKGEVMEYEFQALVCAKGITNPSMNDSALLEKFGVPTPKDLVKALFHNGGEVRDIAIEILKLSGYIKEEDEASFEDEVKN